MRTVTLRVRTLVGLAIIIAGASVTVGSLVTLAVTDDMPVPAQSSMRIVEPTTETREGAVLVNAAGQAVCARGEVPLPLNGTTQGFVDNVRVRAYDQHMRVDGDLSGAAAIIVNGTQWGTVDEADFRLIYKNWGDINSLTLCGFGR